MNIQAIGVCRYSLLVEGGFKAGPRDLRERAAILYDERRMAERLAWFTHVTLPSLLGQTDRRFRFAVLVSDAMPDRWLERLTEVVAAEEAAQGLRAYSIAPGVVDTAMQAQIRASAERDFPDRERFVRRKQTGAFNDPVFVADELLAIAFDPARRPDGVAVRIAFDGEPTMGTRPG